MLAMVHPAFAPLRMHPLEMRMLDSLVHHQAATKPRMHATDTAHVVTLAAPGIAPADVKVEVSEGRLSIVGESKRKRVDVTLALPRDAALDGATAEVADGLITVSLKKRKPTTAHIAIGAALADEETSDDEAHAISLAAPGFSAADLALSVEDGVLKLSGESRRTGARLERRARLPRDVDVDNVSASHVDGILTVRLPTKPAAEPRAIAVNAATDDEAALAPADEEAEAAEAAPPAVDKENMEAVEKEAEGGEEAEEDAVMV